MDNLSSPKDNAEKKSPFDSLNREELINKCKGLLVIAQKAKQAKLDLQADVESYKIELEKHVTEKKADIETIRTLQILVDSLTEQKLNYITEFDTAKNKIKTLTLNNQKNEEEINKSKAELIVKNNTISEITIQLSNLDSEITSLKRQNNRLVEENEQLLNQLSEIEANALEFNEIGLEQRKQLKLLEEKVSSHNTTNDDTTAINTLNEKIFHLETELNSASNCNEEAKKQLSHYEEKLKEITTHYEMEKEKKEKANIKLKSYRDKIMKCAASINQLKSTRFILLKTVQEYSENIPKWQNDIVKASHFMDQKISELHNQMRSLREKLCAMESKYTDISNINLGLNNNVKELELKNVELSNKLQSLQIQSGNSNNEKTSETVLLQIKALESEKSILVREKLNVRDHCFELENQIKLITKQLENITSERDSLKTRLTAALEEKKHFVENHIKENYDEQISLKNEIKSLTDEYQKLKKENENLIDLNGMLKDEVDTLKLSLEQPSDGVGNSSDLNDSLQADLVKLQTKLSSYKQENANLIIETKEARNKLKEFEAIVAERDDIKAKLLSYKSENSELLNEMKEINQVLKERGEAISKQQKAIAEMERLIETLEKDRDSINEEKFFLQNKIFTLENVLRNTTQSSNKNNEAAEQIVAERDNAIQSVSDKDAIILSLKEEVEKLKHQQSSIDLPSEDMSTSTISKAEEHSRIKELDDTFEDRYSKLRNFALKLKKKLNDTTIELQNVQKDKSTLEKVINDSGLNNVKPMTNENMKPNNETISTIDKKDYNHEVSELRDTVKKLTHELETAQKLQMEIKKKNEDLSQKEQQLTNEMEAHKSTKEQLEKAKRDIKKKSVLSLEMEDYEKSMKELTTRMEDKKKKIIQMESTIDTQQGTINTMKTQIKLLEDQIKNEETENRSIKEELQNALEKVKENDNVIISKNTIISNLEQDIEHEKRKLEELNVDMTSLLGEKEKIVMSLCEDKQEIGSKLKKMEFKCVDLEEKLKICNIELEDLKTEYTSYKVRAQAVLRQNQMVDHSQEEQLKEEAAALKAQIESLTSKLSSMQMHCDELKTVSGSEKRRATESAAEASRAGQRTARLQADLARLTAQLEAERTQHKLQVSTLTQCYKTQINELELKLQKDIEELKKQVIVARDGHGSGYTAQDKIHNIKNTDSQYMLPVIHGKEDGSDGEMDINVSLLPREEGEGSEAAPSPPLSKQLSGGGGGRSPVPLERLLEEGVPDDVTLDAASLAFTPEQELSDLKRKSQAQLQRVKHVTVLLAESERECARHAQMNELLKAEVRRARGSLERAQHAHNAEYLKNVTLKFVTLPPGDERSRLVPVLQKILTLNREETQKLTAVATGVDPSSRGWGSYLPWPGGK